MNVNQQEFAEARPADCVLLQILQRALFSCEKTDGIDTHTDWDTVLFEAQQQGVLPIVLENAATLPVPLRPEAGIIEKFHKIVLRQVMNNQLLMASQDEIVKAFADSKISCVILKGSSAAVNYPRPELRVLGDIDILVSKESLESAASILLRLGYQETESRVEHHLDFSRQNVHVELHYRSTFYLENQSAKAMQELMTDAFSSVQEAECSGYTIPILTPERQASFLLLHMQHHLKASGIGLRHLCDFVMFVSGLDKEEWERSVAPALKKTGLWRFAQALAKTGVLWLGLPAVSVPWCMEVRDGLCRDLLREFLQSGNLGIKDAAHRASAVLSADKSGQGNARLMSVTLVRNMNLHAFRHYPWMRRVPVFLPFLWIYLPLKYLFDTFRKGGKPDILSTFSSARSRKKLYTELGIFEYDQ